MNKKTYRLVYSRLRGMVVAVEETATAAGKAESGESRASRRSLGGSGLLIAAASLAAAPQLATAQIAPTPGTSTHVIPTQNGLPQVNIAKPSGAGVSVNTYNQFDVQKNGAILNNSPTIVNTQQAGYINGNPNFGPGQSARIIVNQVNSANPSQLRGYVEVAGSRAEVVLANPAGIVVDGGGFINTSRATLTTGQPYYGADGSLAGYNVNRGLITVQGAGLNAANVDQVDLISRAVQANAAIYAKRLNVVAGANQVNHDTLGGPTDGMAVAKDARSMPNIPSNSQATVVANNPFIPRSAGGTNSMMDFLPEAARITEAGGGIVINGNGANPYFSRIPSSEQLDSLGLNVEYQGRLLPEYQGLNFSRSDG